MMAVTAKIMKNTQYACRIASAYACACAFAIPRSCMGCEHVTQDWETHRIRSGFRLKKHTTRLASAVPSRVLSRCKAYPPANMPSYSFKQASTMAMERSQNQMGSSKAQRPAQQPLEWEPT